MAPTN